MIANDNVCGRPDYIYNIYEDRRRNIYPQRACGRQYNVAAPTFCNLKPSFIAQPFLRYSEPRSFTRYELARGFGVGGGPSAVQAAGANQEGALCGNYGVGLTEPNSSSLVLNSNSRLGTVPSPYCNEPQCSLTLSCGDGNFGESCNPGAAFKRREYPVGVTHIPATSLPVLDHHDWSSPAGLYHYDQPELYQESYLGAQDGHLARFTKFAYQNEEERLRLQYGILPPFPQPSVPPPPNTVPRYQPCPVKADAAPPIPYFRSYLDLNSGCGCNKGTTPGACSTCPATLFNKATPLASIYSQGGGFCCLENGRRNQFADSCQDCCGEK